MNRKIFNRRLDKIFKVLGVASTVFGLVVLLVLLIDVFLDGKERLTGSFFTSFPSRKPELAGILSAWVGTVWIMVITAFVALPLGIGAGIYLEEYAKKNRITKFIEINIANLAGVPSIIYGLLGLALFVRFSLKGLFAPFTVLPIQIFNWVSRPQKGFFANAAAGIIVLLFLTLIMNIVAIILRYRYQKKIRWKTP
ncbi:MAG: hypothetical protein NC898_06570 [Candidatus Omnitrophica bacterium]|nr:hypothetical protein [Candidatus Omnitrophota bacterium]MCM8794097.1 hypothetical protein [Candidatus Omnitrophota bacterium]